MQAASLSQSENAPREGLAHLSRWLVQVFREVLAHKISGWQSQSIVAESLGEARRIIETWRRDYNWCRPHSSLAKLTPSEFAEQKGDRPQVWVSAAVPLH
jgi:transposase InsO family protein